MCAAMIFFGGTIDSYAVGSATTAISASSSEISIGKDFTVTVSVTSGSKIGSVDAIVNYDSGVIEFKSGAGAGGSGGAVTLSAYDTEGEGKYKFSFSLTFTSKKAGTSSLYLSGVDVCDYDGELMSVNTAKTSVSVVADKPLSSNNYLSSLKISSGSLSPAFSKNVLNYTVNVPSTTTTMYLTPTVEDSTAKATVSGSATLKAGTNTRKVTVTAQNGSKRVYTVTIIREAAEGETVSQTASEPVESQTESESSAVTLFIDGTEMTVCEELTGIELPQGFAETVCNVNGRDVMGVTNATGTVVMLYLTNPDGDSSFYIYDSAAITYTPYRTLTVGDNTYIPLTKPRGLALPDGFTTAELTVGDQAYNAWINDKNSDFYMLYLCNANGDTGLYLYDSAEGTVQRYIDVPHLNEPDIVDADADNVDNQTPLGSIGLYIIIGMAVAIAALAAALIATALHKRTPPYNSDFGPNEQLESGNASSESEIPEMTEPDEHSPDEKANGDGNDDESGKAFGDDFIIH